MTYPLEWVPNCTAVVNLTGRAMLPPLPGTLRHMCGVSDLGWPVVLAHKLKYWTAASLLTFLCHRAGISSESQRHCHHPSRKISSW